MRALSLPAASALLLAGCAAPVDPGPLLGGPWTASWGIASCATVLASLDVDPARLEPRLPPGFAAVPGRVPGRVQLHLDAYECSGAGGTWAAYGSYYAPVLPPGERRAAAPDLAGHFVKWDFLVPDPGDRAAYAAAGFPARAGEARVQWDPASGLAGARLTLEGAGGFTLQGLAPGVAAAPATFSYVEFTPLEGGGLATWWAHARAAGRSGVAQVEVEPGSWVAGVLGATQAQATFFAATWTVERGNVTAPS